MRAGRLDGKTRCHDWQAKLSTPGHDRILRDKIAMKPKLPVF